MLFSWPRVATCVAISAVLAVGAGARPFARAHSDNSQRDHDADIRHVLLISIDGMHALDYENCGRAGRVRSLPSWEKPA